MITTKTPPKEIIETFEKIQYSAGFYFLMKNKITTPRELKYRKIKKQSITYKDLNGNKWITFKTGSSKNPTYRTVLCIDTASSMNVYDINISVKENVIPALVHFTPHFFQRVIERNNLDISKKKLIEKILKEVGIRTTFPLDQREVFKNKEFNRATSLGRFFGHSYIQDGIYIEEYTTCIPDTMLSKNRVKNYKDIDKWEKKETKEFKEFLKECNIIEEP